MKNHPPKILLIAILIVLLLTACQSSGDGPDDAYWGYYQACEDGKYATAELYMDEEAKAQIGTIGICGFTHDAINRYEVERGGTERTFTEDPTLDVDSNGAAMTWVGDEGKLAIVYLIQTEDGWKVSYTIWSD